jgi:hypothetical protein
MRFTRMLVVSGLAIAVTAWSASAATITLYANVYSPDNPDVKLLKPGDRVIWEVAVGVVDDGSNMGLASLVYDITSNAPQSPLYTLGLATEVESGWNTDGLPMLNNVKSAYYTPMNTSLMPGYNGGWGFDAAGLPTGGNNTTKPGSLIGAGTFAPLSYLADVNPGYPGQQPNARLGVGHGTYTFPADDSVLNGHIGGFGMDITNTGNIVDGDGHWIFQRGEIDTSGWALGDYNFDVAATSGAVFKGSLDYTQDHEGGFREVVPASEMVPTSFNIRLIPEPMTLGLMVLGGLGWAATRRRR